MTVKLHVGYVGITRDGQRVEIVGHNGSSNWSCLGDNGQHYTEDGRTRRGTDCQHDIIGPWVEPVKSPIETVTETRLVNGAYGSVSIYGGSVSTCAGTQAELEAVIETLILIRDAKVLK